jgi:hypothetical protein
MEEMDTEFSNQIETPDQTTLNNILEFVLPSPCFDRLQDFDTEQKQTKAATYAEFYDWNLTCICDMTNAERDWLHGLCVRLKNKDVKLMDLESCITFTAFAFFFDKKKKLCIVNPR